MKRRTFVVSAAVGAPLALTGCATIEDLPQVLQQTLPPDVLPRTGQVLVLSGNNERQRSMSVDKVQQARLAQALLGGMEHGRRIPDVVQLGPYLQILADDLIADIRSMPDVINDAQLLEIGRRIKHIASVIEAHALQAAQPREASNVPTQGATQRPGQRRGAAGTAAVPPAHRPSVVPVRLSNQAQVTLPRASVSVLEMKGFCLDEGLPAPGRGDLLRLIGSQPFAHPGMRGFEQDLLALAARTRLQTVHVQHILWGLRGIDEFAPYTRALMRRQDLLRIMEQARPGASQQFLLLAHQAQLRHELQARVGRVIAQAIGNDIAASVMRDLLLGGQAADQVVERHLARLMQGDPTPAPANISPLAAFSALQSGVYAHTIGSAPLAARSVIINVSPVAVQVVPAQWTAESMRPQQRVAFAQADRVETHTVGTSIEGFDEAAFAGAVGWELFKKGLTITRNELAGQIATQIGEWAIRGRVVKNDTLLRIARHAPILGNAISLVEAFAPDATPAERVFAALGAVPGWGSLRHIAGSPSRVKHIAQMALDRIPRLARFTDRTALVRDLQAIASLPIAGDESLLSLTLPMMRDAVAQLEART